MTFKVGDTVVYPHHGAALIEAIETRQIKGVDKTYLVLKVAQGDLTVRVPMDNAEFVGVRDVVGQEGLDRVFEVLRAPYAEEPTNWSRRYKANLEKLASGDVIKVAEVVRDLWRRERERGLSAGEKRMLAKARQILVSEARSRGEHERRQGRGSARRGSRVLNRLAPVVINVPRCPLTIVFTVCRRAPRHVRIQPRRGWNQCAACPDCVPTHRCVGFTGDTPDTLLAILRSRSRAPVRLVRLRRGVTERVPSSQGTAPGSLVAIPTSAVETNMPKPRSAIDV